MNLSHLAVRSTATRIFGITGNNCTLPGEKIDTVNSHLRETEQQPFNKTECTEFVQPTTKYTTIITNYKDIDTTRCFDVYINANVLKIKIKFANIHK